jgi:hypothetical protein
LASALTQSLTAHAEKLATSAEATTEQNRRNWSRLQQTLADSTQAAKAQQTELARQAEILLKVVEATGHITKLEEQLNRNLAALAGAQHFEETLLNLSGTINLLNARLGHVAVPQVGLTNTSTVSKAA